VSDRLVLPATPDRPGGLGEHIAPARQRYRGRIIAVAVALLCAAVAVAAGLHAEPQPAGGGPAVPRSVELPYFWQATVDMAPPGPATVLFGGDSLGLVADPFEDEGGKLAVLGRDGDYRILRYPFDGVRAGQDVRLSPDGNLVAQYGLTDGPAGWLVVTDLRTGRSRSYSGGETPCCAQVVAWRPDSGAVLALQEARDGYPIDGMPVRYALIDLAGGAVTPVDDRLAWDDSLSAWAAAFAPDGRGFVAARPAAGGTELRGYDATGRRLWTRDLGARRLAGSGAYTSDSSTLALLTVECPFQCNHDQRDARRWRVSYVDAATGTDREGLALPEVTGAAVRALGWHGDAFVVVQYETEDDVTAGTYDTDAWGTRHVRVLALRPGAAVDVVLDPPDDVSSVDIAQDLLRNGQFGGPVPAPAMLPARWPVVAQGALFVLCLLAPVAVAVVVLAKVWAGRRRRAATG
jgi:hypothetical protein